MSKVKVVVFETKLGAVCMRSVENKLESFQALVEGYIETTSLVGLREQGIIIVCNEEGVLKGLAPNENAYPFFFVGNLVFTSYDDEGDFVSLTDEQVEYLTAFFRAHSE